MNAGRSMNSLTTPLSSFSRASWSSNAGQCDAASLLEHRRSQSPYRAILVVRART